MSVSQTQPAAHVEAARVHGLDWLRAAAALTVVALHAGIAYTLIPFPGLPWPVHDGLPSSSVDALTWWIDTWIMPLFFVMGGFMASQLLVRLGRAEFVRHRARTLLAPLAFGALVVLPVDLYVWLLGWVVEERIPLRKLRSLKLGEAGRDLWGVAHLWFLEYLFVFCLGAALLQGAAEGRIRAAAVRFSRPILVLPLLGACSVLALWWDPQIVIGFRHAWHPLPANLLYYAPCFAAGWWLQRRSRAPSAAAVRVSVAGLIAASGSFAFTWPLIHRHITDGLDRAGLLWLCCGFVCSGWGTALSLFRLALLPWPAAPVAVRYVADASLWMYLLHHPVVGLAQVAMSGAPWPAEIKFVLAWGAAVAFPLLSYEVGVRHTALGQLLRGKPRTSASRDSTPATRHCATACDASRRAA